jgi:hypothetical protein
VLYGCVYDSCGVMVRVFCAYLWRACVVLMRVTRVVHGRVVCFAALVSVVCPCVLGSVCGLARLCGMERVCGLPRVWVLPRVVRVSVPFVCVCIVVWCACVVLVCLVSACMYVSMCGDFVS